MSIQRHLQLLATKTAAWENLSYKEQMAYLCSHPTSKRQRTQMSPAELAQHHKVINSTFADYHRSQRGTEYKDFLGRPVTIDDSEHHRRNSFTYWRANVAHALKANLAVPKRVQKDYALRNVIYENVRLGKNDLPPYMAYVLKLPPSQKR